METTNQPEGFVQTWVNDFATDVSHPTAVDIFGALVTAGSFGLGKLATAGMSVEAAEASEAAYTGVDLLHNGGPQLPAVGAGYQGSGWSGAAREIAGAAAGTATVLATTEFFMTLGAVSLGLGPVGVVVFAAGALAVSAYVVGKAVTSGVNAWNETHSGENTAITSTTVSPVDGSTMLQYKNGDIQIKYTNGDTSYTTASDGTQALTHSDGSYSVTTSNGIVTNYDSNNNPTSANMADGTQVVFNSNGPNVVTLPNGAVITGSLVVNDDGSENVVGQLNGGGTVNYSLTQSQTGVVTMVNTEGQIAQYSAQTADDGSVAITKLNFDNTSQVISVSADQSTVTTNNFDADHQLVSETVQTKSDDGSTVSTVNYDADHQVTSQATQTKEADGSVLSVTTYPDGRLSQTVTSADGLSSQTTLLYPDGTIIQSSATNTQNGTLTSVEKTFPDGTTISLFQTLDNAGNVVEATASQKNLDGSETVESITHNSDGSTVDDRAAYDNTGGLTQEVSTKTNVDGSQVVSTDSNGDGVFDTIATTQTFDDGSKLVDLQSFDDVGVLTGDVRTAIGTDGSQSITYLDGSENVTGTATVTTEADGTQITKNFTPTGTETSDSWASPNGTQGTDQFFSDGSGFGTATNADGSYSTSTTDAQGNVNTQYYTRTGVITGDSFKTADGIQGSNTYSLDGSSSGTIKYADGSYESYQNDGKGNSVVVKYDALDHPLGSEWWKADGSHGSETIDANGGKTGTIWAADGGHTNYSDDGNGNTHVTTYDPHNNITGDHWTNADGSSGGIEKHDDGSTVSWTKFADGSTTQTTWLANGVVRTSDLNADGSGTTALYDGNTTIITTWGEGGVGVTSNTTIQLNPDGTGTVTTTDADGHTTERQALPGEFPPPANPTTPTDPNGDQPPVSGPPSWTDGAPAEGGAPVDNTPLAGSPTAPADPGSSPWSDSQGGDGSASTTYTGPDGTQVSSSDGSNGSSVSVNGSDGSSSVTTSVGEDGSVSTTYNNADGTTSTSQTTSDGFGDTYESWQNSDGASGNNNLYSDGSSYSYSDDGQGNSVTNTFDAGSGTHETDTQNADGSSTTNITNGDGSSSNSSSADGTTVTDSYSSSGQFESTATQTPDGVTVTDFFGSDGGVSETDTMNSDGTGTKDYFDANGDPAGSSTVTVEDGRTTTSNYDNDGVLNSDSWTEGGGYGGSITSGTDVYTYGDDGSVVDNGTIQQPGGDGETDFQKTTAPDGSTQETGNNYDSGGNLTGSYENQSSTNPDGSSEETGSTSYADGNVSSTFSDSTGADGSTDNVTRGYDDNGALTSIETQTTTADGTTTDQGFGYGSDGTMLDSYYNTTSPDGSWMYSGSFPDGSTQSQSFNATTGEEVTINEAPDGSTYTDQQFGDGSYDDSYHLADGSTHEVSWDAATDSRVNDTYDAQTGRIEDASITYGTDGSVENQTEVFGGTDSDVDFFTDFMGNEWQVTATTNLSIDDLTRADGSGEDSRHEVDTSADGTRTIDMEGQRDADGSASSTENDTVTDNDGNVTTTTEVQTFDAQAVATDTQINSVTVNADGETTAWANSEDFEGFSGGFRTTSDSEGNESDFQYDSRDDTTYTGTSVDGQGPNGDTTWDIEQAETVGGSPVTTVDDETRADGSSYNFSYDLSTGDSVAIADDWTGAFGSSAPENFEYLRYGDGSYNDTTWNADGSYSVSTYDATTGESTNTDYGSDGDPIPPGGGDGGDGGDGGGDQPNP